MKVIDLDLKKFTDGLKRVLPFANTNKCLSGTALACVSLKLGLNDNGSFELASTDGLRLARYTHNKESTTALYTQHLFKPKSLKPLLVRLPKIRDIKIGLLPPNHLMFNINGVARTVLAEYRQYPVYDQLIPAHKDTDFVFEFDRKELLLALKYLRPITDNITRVVKIEIDKGMATLTSTDVTASDKRACISVLGNNPLFRTYFNAQYLAEALTCMTDNTHITLRMASADSPALLSTDTMPEYVHLLMPINYTGAGRVSWNTPKKLPHR